MVTRNASRLVCLAAVAGLCSLTPRVCLARDFVPGSPQEATAWQGAPVVDGTGRRLGDANQLMLDGQGRTIAVVVGFGGLLGFFEHELPIQVERLRFRTVAGRPVIELVGPPPAP